MRVPVKHPRISWPCVVVLHTGEYPLGTKRSPRTAQSNLISKLFSRIRTNKLDTSAGNPLNNPRTRRRANSTECYVLSLSLWVAWLPRSPWALARGGPGSVSRSFDSRTNLIVLVSRLLVATRSMQTQKTPAGAWPHRGACAGQLLSGERTEQRVEFVVTSIASSLIFFAARGVALAFQDFADGAVHFVGGERAAILE